MARSAYIYFVRYRECGTLLGAFTVKKEANQWAEFHSGHPLHALKLSSMRDGLGYDKDEKEIEWDD
jgi:hypothetical protein